ncbi:MAG: histidine kinase [Phycisphaerae bacterium]|nr:histidine kinase [Phycisphaerae bacterium]
MNDGHSGPSSTGARSDAPRGLPELTGTSAGRISDYYRRLRRRLQVSLVIAYIVPISFLSAYFHIQFSRTLRDSGKLHLKALAESQRNTVDLFLQERVVNIFHLFHKRQFALQPTTEDMRSYLADLREVSDAFIDVGFFNAQGVQIGYAGPYSFLEGKDYSEEAWFRRLREADRDYSISDVYLGFRQKPHFTIAVRQSFDGQPYVMRATLDPDKFYQFLEGLSRANGVDSVLVNREGENQIVDPSRGKVLGPGSYLPPQRKGSGASEVSIQDRAMLAAFSWLQEVPWALVVTQPLEVAYAEMYRLRRLMIIGTAVSLLIIITGIWLTTDQLLRRAQATSETKEELRTQLIHASKLASVGELAAGVAHEINNPLAIISSESGLIRDMLDPQFNLDHSPEAIRAELETIDQAVIRTKNITQKLLSFVRKDRPRLVLSDVNGLLNEAVGGLKERQLKLANVELIREYDPNLPLILVDPDQLHQVFLNIINNAGDAIEGDGKIALSTRSDGEHIRVTITDTGCGMTSEQMERIFVPFFTTKEVGKGTGLGLSVSLSILEGMGGRLEVQSVPGAGSSFTIVLPIKREAETTDG